MALGDEAHDFTLTSPYSPKAGRVADEAAHPLSPMPGRVVAVHVKAGDRVEPGQALMVLEGMKMEYTVKAAVAGVIEKVLHADGAMVDADAVLVHIKPSIPKMRVCSLASSTNLGILTYTRVRLVPRSSAPRQESKSTIFRFAE